MSNELRREYLQVQDALADVSNQAVQILSDVMETIGKYNDLVGRKFNLEPYQWRIIEGAALGLGLGAAVPLVLGMVAATSTLGMAAVTIGSLGFAFALAGGLVETTVGVMEWQTGKGLPNDSDIDIAVDLMNCSSRFFGG